MTVLPPAAIERLRRLNRASLKDRALVEAPTAGGSSDAGAGGAGTESLVWDAVDGTDFDPIPCRISPLAVAAIATEADQRVALNRWTLTVDLAGPAIGPGYRVTVTGTDAAGGAYVRVLLVLGEHNPRTYSAMRRYACEDAGPGRRT